MHFYAFLVIAALAYAVDIPGVVIEFAKHDPFTVAVIVLIALVWALAFLPWPSDRRWNLILLPLALGFTTACATSEAQPRRETVLDKLCEGYTVDVNHAVLCLKDVREPLEWDSTETRAVAKRHAVLLWIANDGQLIRPEDQ